MPISYTYPTTRGFYNSSDLIALKKKRAYEVQKNNPATMKAYEPTKQSVQVLTTHVCSNC